MVRPIMRDIFFLRQKAQPATKEDKQIVQDLLDTLEQILRSQKVYLERVFPYQEAGKIQTIRKYGELLSEEYQADGIAVKAYVPAELFGSLIVTK